MPKFRIYRRKPIRKAPVPNDFALNITYACDLSCVGCTRACFVKPPLIPAITTHKLQAIYDEARSLGIRVKKSRIVGGEPTLHPQFHEIVAIAARNSQIVKVSSNQFSPHAKKAIAEVQRHGYRNVKIVQKAAKPQGSVTFPEKSQGVFISPRDAGLNAPHPCRFMGGRVCGFGIDSLGYGLCPSAGIIDTLLALNARATSLRQLADLEFLRWQAETICSQCGAYAVAAQKPQVWMHGGTPMSLSYHKPITRLS